jgi:hypothetical protein
MHCLVMTQKQIKSRSGMTAIAAVLALSSTPSFAQDAAMGEPIVETTSEAPVATTSDPLAPDPVATEAPVEANDAPVEASAAPAASQPKFETKATAAPVARRSAATTRASSSRSTSTAQAAPAAPVAAPAPDAPAEVALPPAAPIPPLAEPVASPPVEPVATETLAVNEDMLPVAGAAGLGILALAGAGMAMRRRKRRREEAEYEDRQWALDHVEAESDQVMADVEPEPVFVAPRPAQHDEPAFVRASSPTHDPVQADAPTNALPAGFDVSRFGRHVQAAYRGPTPDNPSLSLKNRLRRASFFDQRERMAAESGGASATAQSAPVERPTVKPAQKPAWAMSQGESDFMFRPAAKKQGFKPAFQN